MGLLLIVLLSLFAQACRKEAPRTEGIGDGDDTGDGDQEQVDLCSHVDCGLHGSCAVSSNDAFCFCRPGYIASPTDGSCLKPLSSERSEPEGEHCALGGTATDSGLDLDDDGVLASGEITGTSYVCIPPGESCPADLCGVHGACVVQDNVPGCVCSSGYMGARCDACAPGFIARPSDGVCSMLRQITDLRDEAASASCPDGSYAVTSGTDDDFNGVLDLDEIKESKSFCKVVRAGNVSVASQAALDALAGVTDITGDLTVARSFVENLSPLSSLVHVHGQVLIESNSALKGLQGLGRLNDVGSLKITGNDALVDIGGLDALRRSGSITIYDNAALKSLDLGAIGVIDGDLWVAENPALESIHSGALRSVVGALVVAFHPVLTDLSGLDALTSVGSEVWLENNEALVDLTGFTKLSDAGGLLVVDCDALLSLDGLAALTSVRGGLSVEGNGSLSAIDGLNTVEIIEGGLVIQDNAQLLTVAGLRGLSTIGGGVRVRDNAKLKSVTGLTMVSSLKKSSTLPRSQIAISDHGPMACAPPFMCVPAPLPPLLFTNYRGTREVPAYALEFSGNPLLTNMAGFTAATEVASVNLSESPVLVNMPFLATLERVNTLQISGSGFTTLRLDALAGRSEDAEGGQLVQIADNPELLELRLAKLDAVAKLAVDGNPKLSTVRWDAISCYSNATLRIADNLALTTLAGLSTLEDCYSLSISGNAALASLEDLDALVSMSSFSLQNNALLAHAPSFPALTGNTLSVTVADNPKLENVPGAAAPFAYLTLLNLPSVTSLDGTNVAAGTKDVRIENLDKLVDLSGLSGLSGQSIGSFRMIDNDKLTSMSGMGKLADVNALSIVGNDALLDLVALSELTQIGPLEIKGNLLLPSLGDLTKLTQVSGSLTITGNPELPNCQALALKSRVFPSGNVANNDMAALCN